jgi:hypothetical protein
MRWPWSRRWHNPEIPESTRIAIPLSPAEVQILVTALQEDDRLTRVHRPDISGGSGFARSEAKAMMKRAGIAAALDHSVVPLLVNQLGMYEYVLGSLQQYAPNAETTVQFQALLTRCHFLAGVAKVRSGWRVRFDGPGVRWDVTPPADFPTELRQITDGAS